MNGSKLTRWCQRAVRHVCGNLESGLSPDEISKTVSELPDLDGLYLRDLDSINANCKKQAAQIFLMSLHANEPVPFLTLYFAGYLAERSSTELYDNALASKTQLEALLSQPDSSEQARNDVLKKWSDHDLEVVIKDHHEAVEARVQDFMKVQRSTGNEELAVATRDRLVWSHRTARDFLDRQYDELQRHVDNHFKVNEALLKALSLHLHFLPKRIPYRRKSIVMLFMNVLYCAALHQISKDKTQASALDLIPNIASDDLTGKDFAELSLTDDISTGDISEESDASSVADAHAVAENIAQTNAVAKGKKRGIFGSVVDKWKRKQDGWNEKFSDPEVDATVIQRVSHQINTEACCMA